MTRRLPLYAPAAWFVLVSCSIGCSRIGFDAIDGRGGDISGGDALSTGGDTAQPGGDANCGTPPNIVVQPEFSAGGLGWTSYVRSANPTIPCDGSEVGSFDVCEHAGLLRTARVTGSGACTGLVVGDELRAFEWRCDASVDPVAVRTVRLNPGVGLADLIDPSAMAFRSNRVTVRSGGCVVAQSSLDTWWDDTVVDLSVQPATLTGSNTVYALGSDLISDGFVIDADHVSVVTLGNAVMRYSGLDAVACTAPGPAESSMLCGTNDSFWWVEGRFDGVAQGLDNVDAAAAIKGREINHSRFHRLRLTNLAENGFWFQNFRNNLVTDLSVSAINSVGQGAGVSIWTSNTGTDSQHNRFIGVDVANVNRSGLTSFGTANIFHRVRSSNNGQAGFGMNGGSFDNVITRLASFNNEGQGVSVLRAGVGRGHDTFAFVTTINNAGSGFVLDRFNPAEEVTIAQLLTVNNDSRGVWARLNASPGSRGTRLAHIAAAHNTTTEVALDSEDNEVFPRLWVGAGLCQVAPALGNWLDDTCNYGDPSQVPSMPDLVGLDMSGALVDIVTSDAVAGALLDASGMVDQNQISDWFAVENTMRGYGPPGAALTGAARGRCVSGPCQLRDYGYGAGASALRGVNGTFVQGGACPMGVDASVSENVLTDLNTSGPNVFLINAYEIMLDRIGDDDGLCESFETCAFAPNIGADQGTFSPSSTCVFSGGNGVTDVTVLGPS